MDEKNAQIEELTRADVEALQREIDLGKRIGNFYLDDMKSYGPENLDRLLDLWWADDRDRKPSANDMALGIGSLLGEFLRSRYPCRWAIIIDANGRDLGMYDQQSGWQFFPRHSVAKRLQRENAGHQVLSSLLMTLEQDGVLPVAM